MTGKEIPHKKYMSRKRPLRGVGALGLPRGIYKLYKMLGHSCRRHLKLSPNKKKLEKNLRKKTVCCFNYNFA